jgi:PAS domain S-box-containing protein
MEDDIIRVLNALAGLVWTALADGQIDFVNQRWCEYTGLSLEEACGWGWQAAIHPEDLPETLGRWRSILASGVPGEMQARLLRFDGEYRWFLISSNPMLDAAEQVVKWYGVSADIEDRRRAEEALRVRELDFRLIVDSIPAPVAVTTPSGEVETLNQPTLEYFGKTFEELKGWKSSEVVHPDDLQYTTAAQAEAHETGRAYNVESRHRRADGIYRWFNVLGLPLRDTQGHILHWFHLQIDIDDRKRAEEALRSVEGNLNQIINTIPTHIYVLNTEGSVQYVNQAVMDYTGLSLEDVKQEDYRDRVIHPEDFKRVRVGRAASLRRGAPFSTEQRVLGNDGQYRWFLVHYKPLLDEQGRIVRWYVAAFDIEDRKQAEEALRSAERDLNQIINTIPALAWSARPDGSAEFFNQQYLDFVGLSAEQASGLGWTAAVHPDDRDSLAATWQRIMASEKPGEAEARMRSRDGEYRWFLLRASPLRDEKGNIVKWYGINTDIDDLKKAEAAQQSSERNLSLTINTIPTLIQVSRPDGTVLSVNQAVLDYYGVSLQDMQKEDFRSQFYHPDDAERLREERNEALKCPLQFEYEQRARGKDGKYRWFLVRYNPLLDDQGRIERWYATAFDIEDRKRAECEREQSQDALRNALAEIQKSESKLRQVIDAIPALAWCNLPDGPNEFLSKGWHEYTGLSPEESHGWGWQAAFHPEDLPPLMERWMKMLASGEPDEIEARLRRHDGVYRWFLIRCEPFRDESGKIVRWYGTSTDIDDRKRVEALLAGEKRLLEMAATGRSLPDVLDALCRFVEDTASRCYCTVYLIDPSGTKFHNAAAPSLPSSFNEPIEGAPVDRETGPCGMAACLKTQVIASDVASDPRWPASVFRPLALAHGLRSCWSTPILSLAGDVLGTFAIYQDEPASPTPLHQELIAQVTHIASITIERSQAEAALKRSEALLAEAQRLSSTGSFSWRVATNKITWSEQLYRIYELETGAPVTLELIRTRVHPEDLTLYEKMVEQARNGGDDIEWQYRLMMPDHSIKYLHAVARATRDRDGGLEYIAAVQDVTERWRSEEALGNLRSELAHVSRVATLGALTASIAHEINQPLSGIITNSGTGLRMLNADPPNVEGARETARRTLRDGNRASEVITRLRALFSKKEAAAEPVDLNDATREVIALSVSELQRSRVLPRLELAEDLPPITGDRVQLQQVILNLLRNASDAMGGVEDSATPLVIRTERDGDDRVRLSVQDAGVGFDPQTAGRLFDAFYTTKSDGMGIGLSVSRSIIESHHGRLWATPNDGPGATFSFSIPCGPTV